MPRNIPIETALGRLDGRDCIFLDRATFEDATTTFLLAGTINGNLCSVAKPGAYVPYSLRFHGVLALKMVELDSWAYDSQSSFDEVLESDWTQSFGGKVTPGHRHFTIQTYDHVFELICESYEFIAHELLVERGT